MKTNYGFEVERLGLVNPEVTATQVLWKVHPAVRYGYDWDGETFYVVTSAVLVPFSGAETYIFPCSEVGEILDWMEMPGSFKGGLDHETAIMGLNHSDSDNEN